MAAERANELSVLARRLGIDVTEHDIECAMGLDDLGRAALRQATDALRAEEEPATSFAPPAHHG